MFETSAAGGGGGGSEGTGGEAASERRRRGRRMGSLVAMAGLRGRGARRLWAWGCRWASSRLIAPAAGKGDDDADPPVCSAWRPVTSDGGQAESNESHPRESVRWYGPAH